MRSNDLALGPLRFPIGHIAILLFGLCWLSTGLQARPESAVPDSVRAFPDSKRLDWLLDQGIERQNSESDLAISYLKMGEDLALQLDDTLAYMITQKVAARILLMEGIYDESLSAAYKGIRLAKTLNDTARWISLLYWESGAYNELGEYDKSIEVSEGAFQLAKAVGNDVEIPRALNSIGEAYRYKEMWDEAEKNYLEAMDLARRLKATDKAEEEENQLQLLILKNNLSFVELGRKNYAKASEYLDGLKEGRETVTSIPLRLESQLCQVRVWAATDQIGKAEVLALEMVADARQYGYKRYEILYAEWLAEYYKQKSQFEFAFQYFERASELRELLNAGRAKVRVALQDSELENLSLRSENEVLEAQRTAQLWLTIGLAAFLLLIGMVSWLLFRNNRKMRNLNLLLRGQNDRLDQANQEVQGLIGIVAHDLKAPLNKSIMLAEMVRTQPNETEQNEKLLGMIGKVCGDGGNLIQDLLEISSLESEQTQSQPVEVNFVGLVKEALQPFQQNAEKKGIGFHFEMDGAPEKITTDPGLVQRVVDNLVSNALKFTMSGRNVYVTLTEREGFAGIKIQDEGPGIGPEDQKKMFRKFQKLSARPTAGETSNGLGLSIVKSLVDRLSGKLEFESELGQGTEFRIWLPQS